jgi:hypothetical protein
MKTSKNYLLAWSGIVVMVVSFVFPATAGGLFASSALGHPISQAASSESADDLDIDASIGDTHVALKRKHRRPRGGTLIVIQIIAVLISKPAPGGGGHQTADLDATITGANAIEGSLLYALAWLAGDADPADSVRALGYDIEVTKDHDHPCADEVPGESCVDHARQLATLLDATLALGSPDERLQFRQGATALGVAPDCSAASTTGDAPVLRAASADSPEDLLIDASIGDRQIMLARKTGGPRVKYMDIKLKEVIVTSVSQGDPGGHGASVDLNVRLTGPDIIPGSLLYALAWLAGQPDPLGSVRALGYDIAVSNQRVHSCPNRAGYTCEDRAHQLATLLNATLGLGSPEERVQFRRDSSAIGVAPDCSLRVP